MDDGYLPTAMGRPDVEMPHMDLPGHVRYDRSPAIVAYDHGITSYNDRRAAYGLERAVLVTEMIGWEIAVSHTADVAADGSKFDENSGETACQTTPRRL